MILHIYGPYAHHDDVLIVGTQKALERLRAALTEALDGGRGETTRFFVNDGEGFALEVRLETEGALDRYVPPYSADYLQDPVANPNWPRRR